MIWFILYLVIGIVTFPPIYMFVEYICKDKKVFDIGDIGNMSIFTLVWPLGYVAACCYLTEHNGWDRIGVKFPQIKIDISRWVE